MRRIVDLSHPIRAGLITYPGLCCTPGGTDTSNLGVLPAQGARFTAAPPAIEGFGTFPMRAFAELDQSAPTLALRSWAKPQSSSAPA